MTVTKFAASAMIALSFMQTQPAAAQRRAPAFKPMSAGRSPMTMDVAGVRLGMSLTATQAALASTYRCEPYRAASFRQLVDSAVAKRRGIPEGFGPDGKAVSQLTCDGPSGEHLRLFMEQTQAGEVVDRINLTISTERVDHAQIVQQIQAKFGSPTEGTVANGSWCVGQCTYSEDYPKIYTSSGGRSFQIIGDRGRNARRADEAAVNAAASLEAPAAKRGAF